MKILAIIPAKLDSTRLKNKNIREIDGIPMFIHSVDYAYDSKYDVDVVVSSESDTIEELCDKYEVMFLRRPKELCGDTEVVDVYEYVINKQLDKEYDIVVGLQPDNPNRVNTFDDCVNYMIENNLYLENSLNILNKLSINKSRINAIRILKLIIFTEFTKEHI